MIRRIVVAGGGTGGHLFPGIAVIEELRRRGPVEVTWVGTPRGIEARLLPSRGERFETLEVAPLKGRTPGELARSLGLLPWAAARAGALLREARPDLVLGLGGYVAGPLLLAAAGAGIPTALLEQNARVGLTNRWLARAVHRAYLSFEETADAFPRGRARVPGNPVRRTFVAAARRLAADPEGAESRARHVLVVGGSQGARVLNQVVPEALARAGLAESGLEVLHQTGAAMRDEVDARYRALGLAARAVPFIDDMAGAYVDSAFVVCRAGATGVAELCAVGRPGILVPYPFAADDHQRRNAEALAARGAAVCLPQDELDVSRLAELVGGLLRDGKARRALADGARRHGRPEAAALVVDDLVDWLGPPPPFRGPEPVTPQERGCTSPRSTRPRRTPRPLLDAVVPGAAAGRRAPGEAPEDLPGLRGDRPYRPNRVGPSGAPGPEGRAPGEGPDLGLPRLVAAAPSSLGGAGSGGMFG